MKDEISVLYKAKEELSNLPVLQEKISGIEEGYKIKLNFDVTIKKNDINSN